VHVLGPSVVTMLGFGMAFVPLTMSAVAGVPPDQAGIASGVLQTSRQVGPAIGLAALATIAATRTKATLATGPVTHDVVRSALTAGYTRAFVFAAIVAASAAVIGLIAAPPPPRDSRWWRHAICAVLGQSWQCEQYKLDGSRRPPRSPRRGDQPTCFQGRPVSREPATTMETTSAGSADLVATGLRGEPL
jgi:hypothetical protein